MDNKIRVHELAKQLKSTSKRILEMLNEMGIENKSYMSVLEDDELQRFYEHTGFKTDKNTESSADDTAAKKIAAQKEQQAQGKSSGVIVRRIIVDNSSSEPVSAAQKTQSGNKPLPPKKQQRQSREAGSGLRSGFEVRTESIEDLYRSDLAEVKKEAETKAPEAQQENAETVKAVPAEPTVRRVKRVKKEDRNKAEEPQKAEEAESVPAAKEAAEAEAPALPAEDETFVFKQYEYSETIHIELKEEPAEPIEIFKKPEPAPAARPVRERRETPPRREFRDNRENREPFKKAAVPPIPTVDPAVAAQETKRDYAGKMIGKQQERESDKFSKKDGRKDAPKSVQGPQKDKYKTARKLVGEKIGVSEIYNDEYKVSYDVDHNVPKKGAKSKKDFMKKARDFVASSPKTQPVIAVLTNVTLPESMTVKDFAEKIKKTSAEVIKKLMLMGVMANQNQVIDFDTAALIASEFKITAEQEVVVTDEDILFDDQDDVENDETAVERPPVVVVMGHVDHGKTSLLDAIRKTSVTTGEAGGITQHIGAYMVRINERKITFLDTPGHEAFTAMRARGAQVTDVAILVVAADDGVMPQTIEAINHAKAANVSIVVAVNKIDKQGANVDRVMQELAEHEVVAEAWGGDVPFVPVSAKTGENIELLLETVLLSADILQLKASPERQAKGTIIEAKLDKNKGPVATLLVQRGTLKPGDAIVSGTTFGRIRTMTDDKGNAIKKAPPSTPVEITGLPEVPEAGELFYAVKDERVAKHLIDTRKNELREKTMQTHGKVSLDDLFAQIQEGNVKDLNIIVKADVVGSVEAVKQSLVKLSTEEVRIKIVHGAVGAITESDVQLASVSNAIIIGFNVRPGTNVAENAEAEGVDIRLYRVIYDAIDDIKAAMVGMLEPEFKENVIGHVEVRQTFKVSGIGTIAGCYVTSGKIVRNSEARIVRDGIVIFEGKLASLKRFKDDVKEVQQGFECGLSFEKFNDIKEGDVVECYVMEEVKRNGQN
ncbi:MAG: translation initiation factor IF-2 [Clostridia bacterium]